VVMRCGPELPRIRTELGPEPGAGTYYLPPAPRGNIDLVPALRPDGPAKNEEKNKQKIPFGAQTLPNINW
jgi:hypothetical protein